MTTTVLVLAGLAMLAAQCNAVAVLGGPFSDNCPVLYGGKCYKIFTLRQPMTRAAGLRFCAKNAAVQIADYEKGTLADIQGEEHFINLMNYMRYYDMEDSRRPDLTSGDVVPVLTGMTYDLGTETVHLCGKGGGDGPIQKQSVWMNYFKSSRVGGTNIVLRASKKYDVLCGTRNYGDSSERYHSVLCEYEIK